MLRFLGRVGAAILKSILACADQCPRRSHRNAAFQTGVGDVIVDFLQYSGEGIFGAYATLRSRFG
jgi:hypothetical protein